MATIGLRDLYRAPITVDESGKETYGTPVRMAKAISAEMSVEVAEAILYADDGADEVVKEFISGELTLNVNDLMPADLAAILGQTQDADGVVYAGEDDEPPYMAIGFRAKKANGMYKVDSCICLYVNPPDNLGCYLSPTHSPEWTRALSYAAQISMFSNIATK